MNKVLVYHIYLRDDIDNNLAYKVNLECLKYYKNNFDKVKFIFVMDDIKDVELRKKGINWASEIGFTGETDFIFRKNTELGEAATVRDYVFNLNDTSNDAIFFAHTKGITQMDEEKKKNSVLMWILIMYFYNLNFSEEVKKCFLGKNCVIPAFYGTLLMSAIEREKIPEFIPDCHYSGAFYWVNKPFLQKKNRELELDKYLFNNRFDTEFFPGYFFNYKLGGLTSHNRASFILDGHIGSFYVGGCDYWESVLEILGDKEEFLYFKEEIEKVIDFKIFDSDVE